MKISLDEMIKQVFTIIDNSDSNMRIAWSEIYAKMTLLGIHILLKYEDALTAELNPGSEAYKAKLNAMHNAIVCSENSYVPTMKDVEKFTDADDDASRLQRDATSSSGSRGDEVNLSSSSAAGFDIGGVLKSLFSDKTNKKDAAASGRPDGAKAEDEGSPFRASPFIMGMAAAFEMHVDVPYMIKGVAAAARFQAREKIMVTDCERELSNEIRRLRAKGRRGQMMHGGAEPPHFGRPANRSSAFQPPNKRPPSSLSIRSPLSSRPPPSSQPQPQPQPQQQPATTTTYRQSESDHLLDSDSDEDDEEAAERRKGVVMFFYTRVEDIAKKYYKFHERFYTRELQEHAMYAKRFPRDLVPSYLTAPELKALTDFEAKTADMAQRSQGFFVAFMANVQEAINHKKKDAIELLDEDADMDDEVDISERKTACFERIMSYDEKIVALYNNEIRMILDAQFFLLCGLKFMRFGITAFSLNMAAKLFEDKYLVQVYGQNQAPPSIYLLLGYMLGFDIIINAIVALVIWVLTYVRNLPAAPSLFDNTLLLRFVGDYVVSTSLLTVMSCIIASVIVRKKYFRYDLEGPRAIRALKDIVFYIALLLTFMPFFAFYTPSA